MFSNLLIIFFVLYSLYTSIVRRVTPCQTAACHLIQLPVLQWRGLGEFGEKVKIDTTYKILQTEFFNDIAGNFWVEFTFPNSDESVEGEGSVSSAGLEMLRKLFPGKKRSVLELVLRRCNHDLLRAVEHFNATHVSTQLIFFDVCQRGDEF